MNGWTPTTPEETKLANLIELCELELRADPNNEYYFNRLKHAHERIEEIQRDETHMEAMGMLNNCVIVFPKAVDAYDYKDLDDLLAQSEDATVVFGSAEWFEAVPEIEF